VPALGPGAFVEDVAGPNVAGFPHKVFEAEPRCVVNFSSASRSRHVRRPRGGRLEDLSFGYVLCYEEQTLACLYPWESLDTVPGSA
jgi:hypothetical protein